jgi:hypothetical protein
MAIPLSMQKYNLAVFVCGSTIYFLIAFSFGLGIKEEEEEEENIIIVFLYTYIMRIINIL